MLKLRGIHQKTLREKRQATEFTHTANPRETGHPIEKGARDLSRNFRRGPLSDQETGQVLYFSKDNYNQGKCK